MKKKKLILFLPVLVILLVSGFTVILNNNEKAENNGKITGTVIYDSPIDGDIVVNLFLKDKKRSSSTFIWENSPIDSRVLKSVKDFEFTGIKDSLDYLVWAFLDENSNGKADYHLNEPTGWYTDNSGSPSIINLLKRPVKNIEIRLKKLKIKSEPETVLNGRLKILNGLNIVQLSGSYYDRGYAHGSLLANQILDMIKYFNIEFGAKSAKRYEDIVIPYVEKHFSFTIDETEELKGIIDGIKSTNTDIFIPEINRNLDISDLKALNCYGEWLSLGCSSVSAWGNNTRDSELRQGRYGGMIIGRNMDGENDLRKATIHHLIIFAITPPERNKYRWISVMWPGFIGTYSGMSEEGIGVYTHKGNTNAGLPVTGFTPKGLIVKNILENTASKERVYEIRNIIHGFEKITGGALGIGNILHIVFPYTPQKVIPAAIFEDDYKGGVIRYPGEYTPKNKNVLMCCNTFIKYSVSNPDIGLQGRRYSALTQKINQILNSDKKTIDTQTMIEILQVSGNNRTEHAIIFKPNKMEVDIAVEDLEKGIREAPTAQWKKFKWEDFFN